jgi:hypothetical protein
LYEIAELEVRISLDFPVSEDGGSEEVEGFNAILPRLLVNLVGYTGGRQSNTEVICEKSPFFVATEDVH